MKIYAFTDPHGNTKALAAVKEAVRKEKPDLVVCTGDLTVFERDMKAVLSRINLFHVPALMLHGNHENERRMRKACSQFPNIRFLHEEAYEQGGWTFLAYGGEGFKDEDERLETLPLRKEFAALDWSKVVFLSHAPPYKTAVDDVGEGGEEWHVGSKTLARLVKKRQPALVLCGHIHEAFHKEDRIGKTLVVNPGPNGKLFDLETLT